MSALVTYVLYAIGIAGMFLLLIGPHEGGHFLFAKLFRVRVIEFSIGAGTRLWSTVRHGTLYAIRLIPIIGYVRMGGMEAGDFEAPNGFHTKAAWQRIVILAAGPAANFLVAMIMYTAVDLTQLNNDPGKVIGVLPGSVAARTGFVPGDRLLTVDGRAVTQGYIQQVENSNPGVPLIIRGVHANGRPFSYVVAPVCQQGQCRIGLGVARIVTPWTAVSEGAAFPYTAITGIVQGLGQLISGAVPGGFLGPNGLTGPVGIADVTVGAVNQGPATYFAVVAFLSVALGFTNLVPFLALDGGRIVVVVLEALRRRPFDRTAELNVQRWGIAALFGAAAVITFLDIQRIATGTFPGVH
ncbi:MAG TPA: M50 family metallopeptidase [Candidatus Dormibacteraeota bacterium]|nr:M50 family metallopeptidase [Candidatus Dormibacteraeota bacterium]